MTEADNRLTRDERLRAFGAICRLFREGHGAFIYPFRYVLLADKADTTSVSVLFSTPKKFHKRANKRNTLRRRMREAYRLNKEALQIASGQNYNINIAIIYSSKEVHNYKTIERTIRRILEEVGQGL